MNLFPMVDQTEVEYKDNSNDKFINLDHTKNIVAANPECKQLIHLPDNRCIVDKNIDQVIEIFEEENSDDLQYMVQPNINIKNMLINISIIPIVKSA